MLRSPSRRPAARDPRGYRLKHFGILKRKTWTIRLSPWACPLYAGERRARAGQRLAVWVGDVGGTHPVGRSVTRTSLARHGYSKCSFKRTSQLFKAHVTVRQSESHGYSMRTSRHITTLRPFVLHPHVKVIESARHVTANPEATRTSRLFKARAGYIVSHFATRLRETLLHFPSERGTSAPD